MTKYQIKLSPRSEREASIQKRQGASTETGTLWDFRGEKATLNVISLSIDLPIYRMDNCRTYSDQQDAIATKVELVKDSFVKGQELSTVQALQHSILVKLARKEATSVSAIMGVLETEGQRDPILITSTGVVVNGNRRLAAMRELYAADESPSSTFAYVRCMVLPPDTSADEIDDIEANEQARPETKLEYDWIGDAQLVRRQINKARSIKMVATQLRRSEADVKNLLQSIEEADLYLAQWAQKPGQYSLVSGEGEQIFGDLPKRLEGQSEALKSASRAIAWSLFENRDKVPGRIYAFNAAFGKLAPVVLKSTAEQLNLPIGDNGGGSDDGSGFDVDIGESADAVDYSGVIAALKNDETRDDAVEALIDAAVGALERDRGQKNKGATLKALVQIHSKLAGIDLSTAGIETYGGIGKQLESINELLENLSMKLAELKQSPPNNAANLGTP
jgi:filamentous hemagglutinin family protein